MCSGNNPDCMCQEYEGATIVLWMAATDTGTVAKALTIGGHEAIEDIDVMFDKDEGQVTAHVRAVTAPSSVEAWEALDEVADYTIGDLVGSFGQGVITDYDVDAPWGSPYPTVITSGGKDVS